MRHTLPGLLALVLVFSARVIAAGDTGRVREPLRVEVNIPAFRVDVWNDGTLLRSYRVAVGTRRYRTPTGNFVLGRIVWNPWWVPPASEWARHEKVTPPGPDNPMGRVKLYFGPMYYLHGTPARSSIGSAASHGCVRMLDEDAIDLARLVQAATGAAISDAAVDSLTGDVRTTREVLIPDSVPVAVTYRLVELRRDTLLLHPDVYRRNRMPLRALVMQALIDSAVDTSTVNAQALRAFLRAARTQTAGIALDSLTASSTGSGGAPRPARELRSANR
jgi:hypothetical protein